MNNQTPCNHRTPPIHHVDYWDPQMVIVDGRAYTANEPTPIVIKEDENTIVVAGVKYQKVEEPKKPQTLYDRLSESLDGMIMVNCDNRLKNTICTIVSNWLPDELEHKSMDSYSSGWNDCLNRLRLTLK